MGAARGLVDLRMRWGCLRDNMAGGPKHLLARKITDAASLTVFSSAHDNKKQPSFRHPNYVFVNTLESNDLVPTDCEQ